MPIKNIILTFGYVESAKTSLLIFGSEVPESTKRKALYSLVEDLYNKYKIDYSTDFAFAFAKVKRCCEPYIGKEPYCPKCGSNLIRANDPPQFNWDNWVNFLFRIQSSVADEYGAHEDVDNPNEWSPWTWAIGVPKKDWLNIYEHAEYILSIALSELHPELKNNGFLQDSGCGEECLFLAYNEFIDD